MLFKIREWDRVVCCFNSNNLIFEKPIYPHLISYSNIDTLSMENLSKFLELCDLSGERKKINKQEYWETIKTEIYDSHNLEFWEKIAGRKVVKLIVDNYIKKHNLIKDNEYFIWRKPIILRVPAETFLWKYNNVFRCLECINITTLIELSKKCDILVCGNDVHSQYVILRQQNKRPILPIEGNHWNLKSQILGKPSPEFLKRYPNYQDFDFGVKKAYISKLNSSKKPLNMFVLNNCKEKSFEDCLMFNHYRPKEICSQYN